MSCHGNNKENNGAHNHGHSPLKHMLHMILCCGLPIVIIGLLPFIARFSPGAGRVLGWIAPFLCPIMMLMMLPMMFRGNKGRSCCEGKEESNNESKPLEITGDR